LRHGAGNELNDIDLDVLDGVAVARFARPDCLNAFRRGTYAELREIAETFAREAAWRALVITGTGRAFCAGQDLDDIAGMDASADAVAGAIDDIQGITRALAAAPKPTLAAINGLAVGFGLECTLAVDLRITVPSAYFMLPELGRGLFHTNGTYHYLPALVGLGLATDMILTGRRIDATEALAFGLVSRVVPEADLTSHALETARRLTTVDAGALAWSRRCLRDQGPRAHLDAALQFETTACLDLLTRTQSAP
jgi:enoyl-CoA hydratase/carnithine racemase